MATALKSRTPAIEVNGAIRPLTLQTLLHIPAAAHTHDGFRAWALSDACPEKLPVMFLNGELNIQMSREEIPPPSAVKTEVGITLGLLNRKIDVELPVEKHH